MRYLLAAPLTPPSLDTGGVLALAASQGSSPQGGDPDAPWGLASCSVCPEVLGSIPPRWHLSTSACTHQCFWTTLSCRTMWVRGGEWDLSEGSTSLSSSCSSSSHGSEVPGGSHSLARTPRAQLPIWTTCLIEKKTTSLGVEGVWVVKNPAACTRPSANAIR